MSERSYMESKLRIYKSFTDHVETINMTQQDQTETTTTISITQHKESGIAEITIVLDLVSVPTGWISFIHIYFRLEPYTHCG